MQGGLNPRLAAAGERTLDHVQVAQAGDIARADHRRSHVGQSPFGIADLEGVVLTTEIAASAGLLAGQDRDVPGNVRSSHGQLVTADGADRGVHDGRIGTVTRLHHICSALVIALLAYH